MQHKRLLCVEEFFWATKSLLETRLIFHKFASTITGYIFVSFLDLLLVHEVKKTLKRKGLKLERKDVVRDFLAVRQVKVVSGGGRYMLRLPLVGVTEKVFGTVEGGGAAAGVGAPRCQDGCPYVTVLFRT